MLKWLVQRVPSPDDVNLEELVTEDPLATLEFQKHKVRKKRKEIYSVNRYELHRVLMFS